MKKFQVHSKSWWGMPEFLDVGVVDKIYITDEKMDWSIDFYNIHGGKYTPKIKMFSECWYAFEEYRSIFSEFAALGDDATFDDVLSVLEQEGFVDATERKKPDYIRDPRGNNIRHALRRCATAAGNPDAKAACRNIIKIVAEALGEDQ